jgi:hypothetical protein
MRARTPEEARELATVYGGCLRENQLVTVRALAMAYELHAVLGELFDLPENGPGSAAEKAWDSVDFVIDCLEPNDEDDTPRARRLQLVGGTAVRP